MPSAPTDRSLTPGATLSPLAKICPGETARRRRPFGYDPVARQFLSGSDASVLRAGVTECQDAQARVSLWARYLSQANLAPALDSLNPYSVCDDKVAALTINISLYTVVCSRHTA